jgi:hypothetical protein
MLRKLFSSSKKSNEQAKTPIAASPLHDINYPSLVLIAWSKAVEGNEDIQAWLKDNGYPELYMASFAILLKDEARNWLIENGYAHVMAMINGAEGNLKAQEWLLKNGFELLYHMALAIDHEDNSWFWLAKHASPEIRILTKSIQRVKDEIEENHNDMHSIGKDV